MLYNEMSLRIVTMNHVGAAVTLSAFSVLHLVLDDAVAVDDVVGRVSDMRRWWW